MQRPSGLGNGRLRLICVNLRSSAVDFYSCVFAVQFVSIRGYIRKPAMKSILLVAGLFFAAAALAVDSPDAREITDPKSLVSQSAKDAIPIPIVQKYGASSVGAAS